MSTQDIIKILSNSAPIFSALICTLLLVMFYYKNDDKEYKKMLGLGISARLTAFICWIGILLYAIAPIAFVFFHHFVYLVFPLNQIFLYRIVYYLTGKGDKNSFSLWHYFIPVMLTVIMGVWSCFVPFETQLAIVKNRGVSEMPIYSFLYGFGIGIFFIFNFVYSLMSIYRIYNYKKVIGNYSADGRSSVGWLYSLFIMTGGSMLVSVTAAIAGKQAMITYPLTLLSGFLMIFQHVMVTYHIIVRNYVIIKTTDEKECAGSAQIDRAKFEKYILEQRPYLNPSLSITDITEAISTNRSYLSAFINREYGMNFATYINRCRMKELGRMRESPLSNQKSGLNLILDAGFGSYRNYLRVKKRLEEQATILPE